MFYYPACEDDFTGIFVFSSDAIEVKELGSWTDRSRHEEKYVQPGWCEEVYNYIGDWGDDEYYIEDDFIFDSLSSAQQQLIKWTIK